MIHFVGSLSTASAFAWSRSFRILESRWERGAAQLRPHGHPWVCAPQGRYDLLEPDRRAEMAVAIVPHRIA